MPNHYLLAVALEVISALIPVFAGAVIVFAVIGIAGRGIRAAKNRIKNELFGGITLRDIKYAIDAAREAEDNPQPRSVFGATSIYLPRITKDFPNFSNSEAIAELKIFISEYLAVRYEGLEDFKESRTDKSLAGAVRREPGEHTVSGVTVHNTAISMYVKTGETATVTYQIAVGYKLDGKPLEERYKVDYSIRLKTMPNGRKALVCERCGAPIKSVTQTVCEYCGCAIAYDDRMHWQIISVDLS